MLSNDDAILSKTITFLRFPLIVAVVFIHTDFKDAMVGGASPVNEGLFPMYSLLHHIISIELASIAVPLFFFISGFLFFYCSDFSLKTYRQKLKKRIRTLLIPYIFWNMAGFLWIQLLRPFLSATTAGKHKLVTDYTWQDWLNLFWNYQNSGDPFFLQFWFIRDLMIVVLFTPVLYYLIRHCKHSAVPVLGVLWMLDLWFKVPVFRITALFFFSFGAWFGINRHDFTADFRPMRMAAACLYTVLVVLDTWLWHCHITCPYLHKAGIIAGLVAAVSWTAYGITKKRLPVSTLLAGSSFFVFAYHLKPVWIVEGYWLKLLSPVSDGMLSAGYLLIPFFIAFMGVGIYVFLRKHFPALTALITGGR